MTKISTYIPQSVNRRIANGSLWSVLGAGSGRAMNLIAMIIAARILGAEGFGGFALVQSTLGLFGMFAGAALGATATRFIAANYRANPERTGQVISLVTGSAFVSAILFGSLIVALSPWLARSVLHAPELAGAVTFGAFLVGFGVVRGVQDATLAGFEAFREIAFLRCLEGGAALLFLPFYIERFGPTGGIAALGLGLIIAFLPAIALVKRQLRNHDIMPNRRGAIGEWRLLRDFSAPSLLASTVATPVLWFCVVLLSRTPGGLVELGLYNAAYQWHGPLVFVPMAIASVSLPILAQTWEENGNIAFRKLFIKVMTLGTILALFPALLAVAISPQIMRMYGEGFQSGEVVLIFLSLSAPLHVASNIATSAIQSMNRPWCLPAFHGFWGATLMLLTFLTIDGHGAEGLARAFFASYFILAVSKCIFILWPRLGQTTLQS